VSRDEPGDARPEFWSCKPGPSKYGYDCSPRVGKRFYPSRDWAKRSPVRGRMPEERRRLRWISQELDDPDTTIDPSSGSITPGGDKRFRDQWENRGYPLRWRNLRMRGLI
jgi:hypothetical protein